jgi:UDP-glucose 4-epimerase
MSVVAITGCSGYIGMRLMQSMDDDDSISSIIGVDVKPPARHFKKLDFHSMEIRNPELANLFIEKGVNKVIHLAFILNTIHDEALMHAINVGGAKNAMAAAVACHARHLVVASSTTVFLNPSAAPRWSREDAPPDSRSALTYIKDKLAVELLVRNFKEAHPGIKVAVVRPSIVYGPNVNNYISRYFTRMPVILTVGRERPDMQFVHEDDVAEVFREVVRQEAEGYFHAVGADTVNLAHVARMYGKRIVGLPEWVVFPLVDLLWKIHFPLIEGPSAALDGIRYPWVVSGEQTRQVLGLGQRRSGEEVVRCMLDGHNSAKS